jgi:hypothetical protein
MRKGFALALTLWIVAIMSLVTALYLSYGKKVVQKTIQLNKKLKLTLETESTIEILKFYASTGYFNKNKILNNNLKKDFNLFPSELMIDGTINIWRNHKITLRDSSGFVNINDKNALINYLESKNNNIKDNEGIIRDSILDWLDSDNFSGLNGAEISFYKNQKRGYFSRNENYFSSLDEIFLIRGLSEYSFLEREKLKQHLILVDYVSRNILTMDINTLGKVYHLSSTVLAQLSEARKEDLDFFIKLFHKFNAGNENYELDTVLPSKILKITVISSSEDNISKEITLLLSLRRNKKSAFEVLEYTD